ncbi:rab-GTPase-TBC domain-containing protein [Myxozyma melibiosi]|uniref:Rab-GTPase-TBC domain-containing protein n=1 Tax=Myxozyma melibiosi TaxID=54550 RepID=A0ABR1F2Z6_9ASCO
MAENRAENGNGASKSRSGNEEEEEAFAKLLEKYDAAPDHVLLAGGVEDWDGVVPEQVDRYGFVEMSKQQQQQQRHSHRSVQLLLRPTNLKVRAPNALAPNHSSQEALQTEIRRESKWAAMATRSVAADNSVSFSFDLRHPKMRSRTLKGVPDSWRAVAWASFLSRSSASASSDKHLADTLYPQYLSQPSSADSQIDLDVPRTIQRHVMFSARYKGGQRLLFRVLHAFSIHRADVGYVQGMAPLAATFLCYFDEATAFVMLVRLFSTHHMAELYAYGFGGLKSTFDDLSTALRPSKVGKTLESLGVDPMLYATKWYLTLFNYAVPFETQLRIWDYFLLLGSVNVLHAAAIALLDSLGDEIGEDFEQTLSRLTAFIDIKDNDLFMRVLDYELKHLNR